MPERPAFPFVRGNPAGATNNVHRWETGENAIIEQQLYRHAGTESLGPTILTGVNDDDEYSAADEDKNQSECHSENMVMGPKRLLVTRRLQAYRQRRLIRHL